MTFIQQEPGLTRIQQTIRELFHQLMNATLQRFPPNTWGAMIHAPAKPGVYVIYGPRNNVLYVGKTTHGNGLQGRLKQHLQGARFKEQLRRGSFRCLVVTNSRERTLLEHLATGCLCPFHIAVDQTLEERRRRDQRAQRKARAIEQLPVDTPPITADELSVTPVPTDVSPVSETGAERQTQGESGDVG